MKKALYIGLAIAVLAVAAYGLAQYRSAPAAVGLADSLHIGGLLPLSGGFADIGQEVNRGALIALEEERARGANITYTAEDDLFDPKTAVSAAQKLLKVDGMAAVFTLFGEEARPAIPVFQNAKVPLLVAWDSNEDIKRGGDQIFSIGFSTEKDAALMADFAYDALGLRKVAVVGTIDPVVAVFNKAFKERFESRGGKILIQEIVPVDQSDHRTTISKLLSLSPDGIYTIFIPPQNGSFLPQLRRTGFAGEVMAADALIQPEIDAAGAAAEGVYFHKTYANNPEELSSKYKAQFGTEPADVVLVSFGYDSIKVIAEAHRIAKEQGITLQGALTKVKISGLGGSYDFAGTRVSERVEKIFQVQNGTPVEVGR